MYPYNNLLGIPYNPGKTDCYSICRRYFREAYGLKLRNYARPENFWTDPSLDLYKFYHLEGFEPVFDQKIEIGDVLLMPLMTPFATHACIVVDDNVVLHHPPGQLSTKDRMRPKWLNRATNIVRHPEVTKANHKTAKKVQLHEVLDVNIFRDPRFQEIVDRVVESKS